MLTPAATKRPSDPICSKCGIIKRSGKASCCGHGGSWFENCGSAGNKHVDHTWQEGIRVCKDQQPQVVAGQQLHGSQPKGGASSDAISAGINSKQGIVGVHMSASTPVSKSAQMPTATFVTLPANILFITPERGYAIGATNTTITHTLGDLPIKKPSFYLPDDKSIQSASADIYDSILSGIYTQVSTIFIMLCWS